MLRISLSSACTVYRRAASFLQANEVRLGHQCFLPLLPVLNAEVVLADAFHVCLMSPYAHGFGVALVSWSSHIIQSSISIEDFFVCYAFLMSLKEINKFLAQLNFCTFTAPDVTIYDAFSKGIVIPCCNCRNFCRKNIIKRRIVYWHFTKLGNNICNIA